jgi:hypothetical protein
MRGMSVVVGMGCLGFKRFGGFGLGVLSVGGGVGPNPPASRQL